MSGCFMRGFRVRGDCVDLRGVFWQESETRWSMSAADAKQSGGGNEPLLVVEDLRTYFDTDSGTARAVDGVSFSISEGNTLAVVGESGSGKTVTALSILQLVPTPPARIVSGSIRYSGRDLLKLPKHELRSIRGSDIAMIPNGKRHRTPVNTQYQSMN